VTEHLRLVPAFALQRFLLCAGRSLGVEIGLIFRAQQINGGVAPCIFSQAALLIANGFEGEARARYCCSRRFIAFRRAPVFALTIHRPADEAS